MKRSIARWSLMVALAMAGAAAFAQEASPQAAQAAVEQWLALVDSQSYAASWEAASTLFKDHVTVEQWQAAVRPTRGPLGAVKSRTVKSVKSTTTLPGAPDGQYVVIEFDTVFEQKAAAVETVIAMREKDGTWRAGTYRVR